MLCTPFALSLVHFFSFFPFSFLFDTDTILLSLKSRGSHRREARKTDQSALCAKNRRHIRKHEKLKLPEIKNKRHDGLVDISLFYVHSVLANASMWLTSLPSLSHMPVGKNEEEDDQMQKEEMKDGGSHYRKQRKQQVK